MIAKLHAEHAKLGLANPRVTVAGDSGRLHKRFLQEVTHLVNLNLWKLLEKEHVVDKSLFDFLLDFCNSAECDEHEAPHNYFQLFHLRGSLAFHVTYAVKVCQLHISLDDLSDRPKMADFVHVLNDLKHRDGFDRSFAVVSKVFESGLSDERGLATQLIAQLKLEECLAATKLLRCGTL